MVTQVASAYVQFAAPSCSLAEHELNGAWQQYKLSTIKRYQDGLELGRACHEWQVKFKAQGSREGKGFEAILNKLSIPKTTAYRWIRRYLFKSGLSAKRNDVAGETRDLSPAVTKAMCRAPVLFKVVVTVEEKQRLYEDVRTLGGQKKVAELVLQFIARTALASRANSDATTCDGVVLGKRA